jgi:hypothetical protein
MLTQLLPLEKAQQTVVENTPAARCVARHYFRGLSVACGYYDTSLNV